MLLELSRFHVLRRPPDSTLWKLTACCSHGDTYDLPDQINPVRNHNVQVYLVFAYKPLPMVSSSLEHTYQTYVNVLHPYLRSKQLRYSNLYVFKIKKYFLTEIGKVDKCYIQGVR